MTPLGGLVDGALSASGSFRSLDASCRGGDVDEERAVGTLTITASTETTLEGTCSVRFPVAESDGVTATGFSMSAGTRIGPDSGDLDMTWTPMSEALDVWLMVRQTAIVCRFTGSAGRGVIPARLVREASKKSSDLACAGSCASLVARAGRYTEVVAGSFAVAVSHVVATSRDLELAP